MECYIEMLLDEFENNMQALRRAFNDRVAYVVFSRSF